MPDVRLVDLEVIRRYSLAVRQEHADAREIVEVLESDLKRLQKATRAARATKPTKTTKRSGTRRSATTVARRR